MEEAFIGEEYLADAINTQKRWNNAENYEIHRILFNKVNKG